MKSLFDCSGEWYKGNLHMHTTLSDGLLSPEAAIEVYRSVGYDFIALTDHFLQSEGGFEDGFLRLSGCEWGTGDMLEHPVFHIVGVGMSSPLKLHRSDSQPPQEIIDAITAAGGLAILAHPAWSVTNPSDCLQLEGLCGAEIYNSISGMPWNSRPDSSLYFDIWASQGRLFRCMAADDSHFYSGEQTRSYIMVKAEGLTEGSIKKAISSGDFYASQGPRFKSIRYDRDRVLVECSDVETIVFYSHTVWCSDRVHTGGLSEASYAVKPTDRYVRVELIDSNGNRAWCSPFAVNGAD